MRRWSLAAVVLVASAGSCGRDRHAIRTHAIPCVDGKCAPPMICVYDPAWDPQHPPPSLGPGFCAHRCENLRDRPMYTGDCPPGLVCRARLDVGHGFSLEMLPPVCLSAEDFRPFQPPVHAHPVPCVDHQCEPPMRCVYDQPDALDPGFCARPCKPEQEELGRKPSLMPREQVDCPAGSVCDWRSGHSGLSPGPEVPPASVCLTPADQRASSDARREEGRVSCATHGAGSP